MGRILSIVYLLPFWLLISGQLVAKEQVQEVCENLSLLVREELTFSVTELQLLCDQKGPQAWSLIPVSQKKLFMNAFLQQRGYFYPKYELRSREQLVVDVGKVSRVSEIELLGNSAALDISRYWQVSGKVLTPSVLNDLEAWVAKQYGLLGYPCLESKLKAFPDTGKIEVSLTPGERVTIEEISSEGVLGLRADVERRYDPFAVGDYYDSLKVELSAARLVAEEIVLNSSFRSLCPKEPGKLYQSILSGEPRLASFGIGFDTEEYGVVEGSWKHTRLSDQASILHLSTRASFLIQRADASLDWYYAPMLPRHFIRSRLSFIRKNENHSDSRQTEVISGPVWQTDLSHFSLEGWPALAFSYDYLARGEGKTSTDSLALSFSLSAKSHDYEFFAADPRSGWEASLASRKTSRALGSDYTTSRYELAATRLFNLYKLDPPLWVLGFRAEIASLLLGDQTAASGLPTHLKLRLGGSNDIRGFARQTLPSDGALTTAYVGTELRLRSVLPYGLQPFVFLDSAKFGYQSIDFEPASFYSPGLGVHWASPIGTIRGSVAKAFENAPGLSPFSQKGYHFYFSFGEQF